MSYVTLGRYPQNTTRPGSRKIVTRPGSHTGSRVAPSTASSGSSGTSPTLFPTMHTVSTTAAPTVVAQPTAPAQQAPVQLIEQPMSTPPAQVPSESEKLRGALTTLGTPEPFQQLIFANVDKYEGLPGDQDDIYILSVLKVVHPKEQIAAFSSELATIYDMVPADPEALALFQAMQASSSEGPVLPMKETSEKKFPVGIALVGAAALAFLLLKKK